jgi:hypothetical protein
MSSMPQIVAGVLIAVAAFILQEVVRWAVGCALFRQRLMVDIKSIVENFRGWCPPNQIRLGPSTDGAQPELTVAPIWDYGYESSGDVYNHSSSLTPDLFVRVISLYSACGRFDEIRCAYNKAIMEMIGFDKKERWVPVLNGQLTDMGHVVREIVSEGSALIADMRETFWFVAQLHELVTNSRKTSPSQA